jgi:putative hemolysin
MQKPGPAVQWDRVMPADEMADQLGNALPQRRDYEIVAGLVLSELQHVPDTSHGTSDYG